jgi:puromycin-sensitive aminopeptidase
VKYEDSMLANLHQYIESKMLNVPDRLGIIRDAFALAEAGKASTVSALSLVSLYKDEDAYSVWTEVASGLGQSYSLILGDPSAEKFKIFARDIFKNVGAKAGWEKKEGEAEDMTLLRSLVLGSLGFYGDESVVKKSKSLFAKVSSKNNPILADIRGAVYLTVARNGGESEFKKFVDLYKKETLSEEKNRLGNALTQFKDKEIIESALNFAISEDVRAQDFFRFFATTCSNPYGKDIAWKFMQNNWKLILERYGIGGHALSHLVGYLAVFSTDKRADEIEKFFKTHQAPGAERAIEQSLEKIRSNALWVARDKTEIKNWLKKIS